MTDSSLLRAAENLFSKDTLFSTAYVLTFLTGCNYLEKYVASLFHINKKLSIFLSAWASALIILVVHAILERFSLFINRMRFGANIYNDNAPVLVLLLAIPIYIALLYVIYVYISEPILKKINNIVAKSFFSGVIAFVLASVFSLTLQSFMIGVGKTNIPLHFAIWINATAGCAIAFIIYNNYKYLKAYKDQERELKISHLQQQLIQSQLDMLSAKINPHFLYNALNSIAGLATTNAIKARDMAVALSKLFRFSLNKDESNYTTVAEEVEMCLIYLEVEKIRFDDKLNFSCVVAPEANEMKIPRNILQPLVENAVKHGGNVNGVEITIKIKIKDQKLQICVGDNGKPFDKDFNPGYGIKSLYDKFDLLEAGKYDIIFSNEPKEVCIFINK